jgi:hypothetical protein
MAGDGGPGATILRCLASGGFIPGEIDHQIVAYVSQFQRDPTADAA